MTVAALFVRADSIYKTMPGVDAWDMERDARKWPGGCSIVAHPPCRAWASLRTKAKPRDGEKDLARQSMAWAREWGGVVEHPWLSTLWDEFGLRHKRADAHGFLLPVSQWWFGHRAEKRTGLYIVGCLPGSLPDIPMQLGAATHTVGLWSGRDRATCRPSISKPEFEHTPPSLAQWLVDLARRCKVREEIN